MSWSVFTDIAGKAENFLNAVDKGAATALTNVNRNVRRHSIKSDQGGNDHLNPNDTEIIDTPEIMSLRTSPSTNSLWSENGNGMKQGHARTSSHGSSGSRGSKPSAVDDDFLGHQKEDDTIPEEWQALTPRGQKNKQEIKEVDSLNKRLLDACSEYKKLKVKTQNFQNQCTNNEKQLREMRSKESDLMASIEAKDSQIAAFKVQIEQLLLELQEKEDKCKEMETVNVQLVASQNARNDQLQDGQATMVANMENQIESLKNEQKAEREEARRAQENNNQQILRLEDNQRSLIEELDKLRAQLNETKSNRNELELANNRLQKRITTLEEEYGEFRRKANKTLKDKDELIQRLNSAGKEGEDKSSSAGVSEEFLQEQCNTLVAELTELRTRYDKINAALEAAENEKIPRQEYELAALKEELEKTKQTNVALRNDVSQLTRDCKASQDDLNQIRANLSARIAERDEEIDKLRKQLVLKQRGSSADSAGSGNGATNDEWEQRLRSLTENLIAKQSNIEQLSSANHSLKLQLERSEQRLRELASSTNHSNDVAIGIYHSPTFTNLIRNRMGHMANGSESVPLIEDDPNDGQVTRKVKRAYTAIDAFSIRLGSFLRHYPSARAAFLLYILVLHAWVAFVLMYYEPEIHGPDFQHTEK